MNIREYRKRAGLSQRQLAETIGITQCYLSQLENGSKRNLSPLILYKLAKTLAVSMEQLLEEKVV